MPLWGLILVLASPGFVQAEPQYYGSRVQRLVLEGAPSQTDLQTVPLKVGDLITPENIRAGIQALYDTGRYSQIEVDVTRTDLGAVVTFRVVPHSYFSTFRLLPEGLLERPLSGYFRIPVGQKFSRSSVDSIIRDTLDLLKAQGYFQAAISPEYQFDNNNRLVSVVLRTQAGPRAQVSKITVQGGEQTFSQRELLGFFKVDVGDDFLAAKVETGMANIRKEFTDLGFVNTRITVEQSYMSAAKGVELMLNVEPGQFTLVQTRGYDISRRRLRELVPIFEEGAVDPDLVEEGRVNIERFLEQQGYFETTVESEQVEAPLDNAIQINYTVNAGPRHRIRSVNIEGTDLFSDDEI